MMGKKLKCRFCNLTNDVVENMECEEKISESGVVKRQFFHKGECWQKHLERKEFIRIELEQLDSLCETVKSIHKMEVLPNAFFSTCLQPLRNGNFQQTNKVNRYKKGVSYKMMEETYKHCVNPIEWAKTNKVFNGSMAELKYCFAIVIDKIYVVAKKIKREQALETKVAINLEKKNSTKIMPERELVQVRNVEEDEDEDQYDLFD